MSKLTRYQSKVGKSPETVIPEEIILEPVPEPVVEQPKKKKKKPSTRRSMRG